MIPYGMLATLCLGGWAFALIFFGAMVRNGRLAIRTRILLDEANARTEEAVALADRAIAKGEAMAEAFKREALP